MCNKWQFRNRVANKTKLYLVEILKLVNIEYYCSSVKSNFNIYSFSCSRIETLYLRNWSEYKNSLKNMMIKAHGMTKEIGSTTLVLTSLDEDKPILRTAYIGDSGYTLYR